MVVAIYGEGGGGEWKECWEWLGLGCKLRSKKSVKFNASHECQHLDDWYSKTSNDDTSLNFFIG